MTEAIQRSPSYVGVSGVVDPYQQELLSQFADESGLFDVPRALLLGVKATHKTQMLDIENKYGKVWYPVGEDDFKHALSPDFSDGGPVLRVVQTYLEREHVADEEYRNSFMERIMARGRQWIQGVQFDMLPWHADDAMLQFVEEVKDRYDTTVLLQCYKGAMEELGPKGVVKRLGRIAASVDYILFDASHGTGARLDTSALGHFLEEAYSSSAMERVGMGVAGGLDASTVRYELPELLQSYPDVSWDAEGKLHPMNSRGNRILDLGIARSYLQASTDVLRDDA